jgi:hypothetical protein
MQETVIIREMFSSRDDAEDARERLQYGGFARNSMKIMRIGDEFELEIHTRPEHRDRVEGCINASDAAFQTRKFGRKAMEAAPSAAQSLLLVGTIAAGAAALYYGFTRRRDIRAQAYPAQERSAVRRLYQAHREEHEGARTGRTWERTERVSGRAPALGT